MHTKTLSTITVTVSLVSRAMASGGGSHCGGGSGGGNCGNGGGSGCAGGSCGSGCGGVTAVVAAVASSLHLG